MQALLEMLKHLALQLFSWVNKENKRSMNNMHSFVVSKDAKVKDNLMF